MLPVRTLAGITVTIAGLVGVFVSWVIQTSDYDPTAMGVAFFSIAVAIIGISLIICNPSDSEGPKKLTMD